MANQTRASLLWKICRQKTQIFPCHLLFSVYVENHDATRSIINCSFKFFTLSGCANKLVLFLLHKYACLYFRDLMFG